MHVQPGAVHSSRGGVMARAVLQIAAPSITSYGAFQQLFAACCTAWAARGRSNGSDWCNRC